MPELKLIAFDADDLAVMSAHLQDAVLKVGDIAYLPRETGSPRSATASIGSDALKGDSAQEFIRRRTALRFERVLGAKVQGIDLDRKDAILALLAISYEPVRRRRAR